MTNMLMIITHAPEAMALRAFVRLDRAPEKRN
jgi:hypothetical protein